MEKIKKTLIVVMLYVLAVLVIAILFDGSIRDRFYEMDNENSNASMKADENPTGK